MKRLSSKDVELIKRLDDIAVAVAAMNSEKKFLKEQLESRLDSLISDNSLSFDEHGQVRVVASTGEIVEITRTKRSSISWRTVAYSFMPVIPEETIRRMAEEHSVESTFTSAEVVSSD